MLIFLIPADGSDAYAYAKKIGRFRLIKRTEGVSSTDIVGRMLMCTRINPRMSQVHMTSDRLKSKSRQIQMPPHTST